MLQVPMSRGAAVARCWRNPPGCILPVVLCVLVCPDHGPGGLRWAGHRCSTLHAAAWLQWGYQDGALQGQLCGQGPRAACTLCNNKPPRLLLQSAAHSAGCVPVACTWCYGLGMGCSRVKLARLVLALGRNEAQLCDDPLSCIIVIKILQSFARCLAHHQRNNCSATAASVRPFL